MERRDRPGGLRVRHDRRGHRCTWRSASTDRGRGWSGWSAIGVLVVALLIAWVISVVWPYLVVAAVLIGTAMAAVRRHASR